MKLKAIKHVALGAVVYLRPDRSNYQHDEVGILISTNEGVGPWQVVGDTWAAEMHDADRCVEIVSIDLMQQLTGMTRKEVRTAIADAKNGNLLCKPLEAQCGALAEPDAAPEASEGLDF